MTPSSHGDAAVEQAGAAEGGADVEAAPSLRRYARHLEATATWLGRSLQHGRGGSSAYFSPLLGWSRPYPETSGYLIPTLISLADHAPDLDGERRAAEIGAWLLSIQDGEGWWHAGLHPPRRREPSVFNTAQVLRGLVSLHELTGEPRWIEAAVRAGRWLAAGLGDDGLWPGSHYRQRGTPSYYTYAAAPMLSVGARAGDEGIRAAAVRVLEAVVARRRRNGTFARWGFAEGDAAYTHTIAYTIQGLLEAAAALDDWPRYGEPAEAALAELHRRGELAAGRLPGRLDEEWRPAARYVCLTGNAQLALCLLAWERRRPDLRLVNAAARLLDAVCAAQRLRGPGPLRGAVGGSSPLWGRYMVMRYPNWAAKYHCDALIALLGRLREEWRR